MRNRLVHVGRSWQDRLQTQPHIPENTALPALTRQDYDFSSPKTTVRHYWGPPTQDTDSPLQAGARLSTSGLDEHVVKAALRGEAGHRALEVLAQAAANAAVGQRDQLAAVLSAPCWEVFKSQHAPALDAVECLLFPILHGNTVVALKLPGEATLLRCYRRPCLQTERAQSLLGVAKGCPPAHMALHQSGVNVYGGHVVDDDSHAPIARVVQQVR